MAEQRQFTLIGNFTDNITRPLESVNKTLDKTLSKLERFHTLGAVITGDFKSMAAASRDFRASLKGQAKDINDLNAALKRMSTQMGKVNRAYRAGGNRYIRQAGGGGGVRPPRGGGGVRAPRGGGGGGGVAGGVIVGNLASGAIVNGFQAGVQLMYAPFKYFVGALGERLEDEISDIKTAGALFGISKRQDTPFLKNFQESVRYTQENNKVLSRLAADLPGSTEDYVRVFKQTVDTLARTVTKDTAAAVQLAEKYRQAAPEYYGGKAVTGTGAAAQKDAIKILTAELTKKTVLAGFQGAGGGGGGVRGVAGPYGLPGLTERLISQEQVSVGQFQRYAAIFREPAILDALNRHIGSINKTGKETTARVIALNNLLDDILPNEQVEALRGSVSGVMEALRTAILGPETGFFGLGRVLKNLGPEMNQFGQYIDKFGNVTNDINKAAPGNISLFEAFRDIFANIGRVLAPIIDILPLVFDPLQTIGNQLKEARVYAARIRRTFEGFLKGYEEFANTFSGDDKIKFLATRRSRAALDTFAAVLENLGAITSKQRAGITSQLKSVDADFGKILQQLLDSFFQGPAAGKLGNLIGRVIGTVINQLGTAVASIAGLVQGGPFAEGLNAGFTEAGGREGIKLIIKSLFELAIKGVLLFLKEFPIESLLIGGALIGPGRIAGAFAKGGKGARGAGGFFGPTRRGAAAARLGRQKAGAVGGFAKDAAGLGYNLLGKPGAKQLAKLATVLKPVSKVLRLIPGGALVSGLLGAGVAKATGASTAGAIGSGVGGVAGAAIGSIIAPGVGTAIGGFIGSYLGEWIGDNLQNIGPMLTKGFSSFLNWFKNLPQHISYAVGYAVGSLENAWAGLKNWWNNLPNQWNTIVTNAKAAFANGLTQLGNAWKAAINFKIDWGGLVSTMVSKLQNWWRSVVDAFKAGREDAKTPKTPPPTRAYGGVGTAMMRELAMAPKGSKLVIANSSETILPAGYSMAALGGGSTINAPITIYQQPGQDPEALASLVALKISNAVNDQRSSYFV